MREMQTRKSFCGEQRGEAQEGRAPCSAAGSEWGLWALSPAWAGPVWLPETPWLEVTGESRMQRVKCSWAARCRGARCVLVTLSSKIEITILLVSFLIFLQ